MRRAAALALFCTAVSARAGGYYDFGEYATVGPLLTGSPSISALRGGVGVEGTYGRSVGGTDAGLGGFAQALYLTDGAFDFTAGIQPTFAIVGLEVGAGFRTDTALAPAHGRIHIAPFISALGMEALSLRLQIPVTTASSPAVEFGLGLTFKLACHREWFSPNWRMMPNN